MTRRSRHPDKEIEEAIKYAEQNGWSYKDSGNSAHSWGQLLCLYILEKAIEYLFGRLREARLTARSKFVERLIGANTMRRLINETT